MTNAGIRQFLKTEKGERIPGGLASAAVYVILGTSAGRIRVGEKRSLLPVGRRPGRQFTQRRQKAGRGARVVQGVELDGG